jgi:hypothetical protein
MKKSHIFLIFLATLLLVGFVVGKAGPVEGGEISPPQPTLVLEPFYLIQEHGARVWIERIIVTVGVGLSLKEAAAFHQLRQRSRIFEILVSESEQDELPAKAQAALNQVMKEPAVTSVELSRSFLLF